MTRQILPAHALAALLCCPFAADAARPLITDDARTVDAYACQVESWIRNNRNSREYWALPACNFTGNLELTLGGAKTDDDLTGTRTTDIQFQGKTLFKPLETNGYGIGLAAGYVAHPASHDNHALRGDAYFYVPASFSFAADRFVLHTNLGAKHVRAESRNRGTWGIGSETLITPRLFLIAETFGETYNNAAFQIGLRFWIVPNHVQVDTTYGSQFGDKPDSRWFSVGLRLLSLPFLK